MDINLKVESLISAQGAWKIEVLKDIFIQEDADRILSFPPALSLADSWVWAYTREGVYNVKSGNWLGSRKVASQAQQTETNKRVNELKTQSWKIDTEPKIRLFLWRLLSGALTVAERIIAHGMQANSICSVCRNGAESIKHVMFDCFVAKQVWRNTCIPVDQWNLDSVEAYIKKLYEAMNKTSLNINHRRVIPWLLWGIWKERNSRVYAVVIGDPHITTGRALEESYLWFIMKEDNSPAQSHNSLPRRVQKNWQRPRQGILKCNVNSFWSNPRRMCGGSWIFRDCNGEVIYHAREAFLAASNRIAAEFRCVLWTLRSLLDIHIENVEIWSDCGAMVEAVKNPKDWPRYRSYIDLFEKLRRGFRSCILEASSSQANTVARRIAASVILEGRFNSYLAAGDPSWLSSLIISEKSSGR
ncbi:putative protein phosphatase 2C-like protein 45 [Cardamine amara subsp. amara]|uniref:Reverse transcriptase n=1 Tax=Cardamine amara subsp. amara TaxID=228776 RepID=A0ABD0Z527_CARAN